MPGQFNISVDNAVKIAREAEQAGIPLQLFSDGLRSRIAAEFPNFTHVGNPGVKQIHDILSMLGVEKVVTAFIIELCERLGRDFSQRGRSRITEGHASRSIGQHITKGDRC